MKCYRFYLFILILSVSCSKEDTVTPKDIDIPVISPPRVYVENFAGPSYSDNYTPLASWQNRDKWQLANIHDPTVVKQGEYFYMYQTDASYGNAHDGHGHFHGRRSKDLVNWEYLGGTMEKAPAWVKDSMNVNRVRMNLPTIENPKFGFWAPCVKQVGTKYRMYYSLVVDELITGTDSTKSWGERPYIGLMETTDLASNQWEDKGMVITAVPDGVEDYYRKNNGDWNSYYKYNAIDPSYIVTPENEHWLIYGSWATGIAAVQLDPNTGKPFKLNAIEDYGIRIAGRGNVGSNRWQALEGAEIIYNSETGYYYLFLAYDELSKAYNTRVARSTSITGPYYGIDGQNVTNGNTCLPMITHPYKFMNHTGWVGFSHCTIFKDEESQKWFYASQARLPDGVPGINVSNAVMMGHVRLLKWTEDGWPVIDPERYAAVPNFEINPEDIVGTWEHIDLNYQYQQMQESSYISFNANGKTSGALNTSWAFDSDKLTLTIGDYTCQIFHSYNWEANPRKVTICYSGVNTSGKTIWGKKLY